MKIYLDNCCYNRPYDDQSQIRVRLEAQAKIYIQNMIIQGKIDLVTSFVLLFENSRNRDVSKRESILRFIKENTSVFVSGKHEDILRKNAAEIMDTGVKEKDALHISAAIFAECDYFITTDDRLLKYKSEKIGLLTPEDLIRKMEV